MTYSEFLEKLLIALYQESQETDDLVTFDDLTEKYGLESRSGWLTTAKDDLQSQGFITGPRHLELDETALGRMTGAGLRYIEQKYGDKDGVGQILEPLPSGVTLGGRIFSGPEGSMDDIPGRPGDILLEYPAAEPELLPASDRLVPLNHNSAQYREVKEGIAELYEELRTANDLDCAPEERERLLTSLLAAQRLWDAAQLKVIQIKVGIIITMQDTIELLTKVGKAVGKSVLIDVVKAIVKHAAGFSL